MANLVDYIDWRGDLSFALSPFNEVDNLALCKLTSLDFTGIIPTDGSIDLPDATRAYLEKYGEEDKRLGLMLAAGSVTMMRNMAASERYSGLKLCDYVNHVDALCEEQFSAMTIALPDGTHYVAFRGTDDNIIAWKEDFNMGTRETVPAQADAAAYLLRAGWKYPRSLYIGGHSKGGNLAVYAAMNNPPELQERIIEVFNNDGPGFRQPMSAHPGYLRIKDRVRTLVPQHSFVGVLLYNDDDFEIVESSETGISAHNGFTWKIMGTSFVRSEEFSLSSRIFKQAVHGWADNLSVDKRQTLIDTIFDALQATGAVTLTDLTEQKLRKALGVARDLLSDAEQRQFFTDSMELLIKEYMSSVKDALPLGRLRKWRGQ